MTTPPVKIQRLPHAAGLPLPAYATPGAAGMDLTCALPADAPLSLAPGDCAAIPTGFAIALPEGFEAQVRPRSGLARNHGVTVLNSPGTVDCDYRGEIAVLLVNHGRASVEISRGMRIAQMVVAPVVQIMLEESGELSQTARGSGGFGSTGLGSP
ncbi:dUTP diphosphatase [Xanthobacter autotrophicus DSM 597]|uniref:dUTP diphosphatase n=1 Tax=Xanthobacter TaxID=279 RepID=UPI001AE4D0C8|nr:dUTP pyrophosphatase [Xanthobacter flavus]